MPLGEIRGGAELMLWQLVSESGGQVEWAVAFLEDGPLVSAVRRQGIPVTVVQAGRLRNVASYVRAVVQIARFARAHQAAAVVGWMTKGQLYASPASRIARIPATWYQLGLPSKDGRLDRLATLLPAKAILAVSEATALAQARLRPVRPIRVVYPGVDLDRFDPGRMQSPADLRAKLKLPATGPLVGIFGRLQSWKGMHVLVGALPAILESHPSARCVIVGGDHPLEPGYRNRLTQQARELGVEKRVILAGPQENVPEWMQAMDVVVHSSDSEPFGIVVIEAMALGKAVVAGANGGPTEIASDGENAVLVPYGDTERLARAVLAYFDDHDFARRLGQSARRRAQEFSVERYVREVSSAVGSVASAR
jgi:glycosyltransferase involved in cell wall biosynthesis